MTALRVRNDIPGAIGRPRFVLGTRRDEEASRDDVTEEQRRPGPKMGLPLRAGTLLDCAGVAHRFHTPGMRTLLSLARSKMVSANCTGYFVTDPKEGKSR